MIRRIASLLLVVGVCQGALGQGPLKQETLEKLKRATVFVRIDVGSETASGSGFVLGKIQDRGYIATNSHVIAVARELRGATIKAVFHSGTREEIELPADVVGDDPARDLALLVVRGDKLPNIINSTKQVEIAETLPVYVVGFPFGEALATAGRNPAITVSKGEISSIRRNEYDRVAAIQIDGGINPGNSGGPVVDANGDLVGIAVAKVRGTGIGFAIPTVELRDMLLGRLASVSLTEISRTKAEVTFEVTGQIIDPLGRIQRVDLYFIPKGRVTSEPQAAADGTWSRLTASMQSFETRLDGQQISGRVTLAADAVGDAAYWYQPSYTRADKKPVFAQPAEFVVARGTEALVARDRPTRTRPPAKRGDDDWLGEKEPAGDKDPTDDKNPTRDKSGADDELFGKTEAKPKSVSEPLGGERKPLDGSDEIFVTPVDLPADKVIDTIVYARDGKHVYLATADGVLRKVSVPELIEVARLEVGSCGALAMSKAGLVAALNATQRVLVIDEETLNVKKQIRVGGATYVTCSPQSNLAVACANFQRSEELYFVDLVKGTVNKVDGRQFANTRAPAGPKRPLPISDFSYPTLTPDGKHLFACSFECLHRFAVKGNSLVLEESGPRIGQNPQGIEISIDGKYVALPSGGGNYGVEGHPQVGYGTYIYSVGDLQSPRIGIKTGAYPRELSLDPIAKLIYAQNHDHQLLIVNTTGVEQGKYRLAPQGGDVREFALHPSGKQLLVLMERMLAWVEIRRD